MKNTVFSLPAQAGNHSFVTETQAARATARSAEAHGDTGRAARLLRLADTLTDRLIAEYGRAGNER